MSNKVVLILVIVFLLAVGAIVLISLISSESGSTKVAVPSNTDEKSLPVPNIVYSIYNDIHSDSWVSGEGVYMEKKRTRITETYEAGLLNSNSKLCETTDLYSASTIPAPLISCNPIKGNLSIWESKPFPDTGKLEIKWANPIAEICNFDRFYCKSCRTGWLFGYDGDSVILSPINGDIQPVTTIDSYFFSDMNKNVFVTWYMDDGSPGFVCYDANSGNVIWNTKLVQMPDFIYIFDPNIIVDGEDIFIIEAGFGLYCLDIATGAVKWRVKASRLKDDTKFQGYQLGIIDDFLFGDQFCVSKKYIWLKIDFYESDNSRIYRINKKNMEIARVQLDNIEKIRVIDNKLYCISDSNELYIVNPKNGIVKNTFSLDDYFSGAKWHTEFYASHPLLFKIDENEYIFRTEYPENPIDLENKEYWNTWYDREKLKTTGWLGWDCYYYEDEGSFTGLN
ncbi:MAG: PQQ-like beta-propeller repeat protein, partial [Caldisericia bacterium]|nr:PQQ-like beta-propeller repeat protein [Caldisericia bacterium]